MDTKTLKTKQLELLQQKLAIEATTHIYKFARYMAPEDYNFNWHHELLYDHLERWHRREIPRLIIEMPPGHGKSEGVSRILPAYILGKNPDARVMTISHTRSLAEDMSRDVQRLMMTGQYRRAFPQTKLAQAAPDTEDIARQTASAFDIVGRRGYYKSNGVGGAIAGRRFEFGIIDDPVAGREEANSPTLREKIWRWYNSDFWTRQAKDSSILITMTRWHKDDLVGRIIESAKNSEHADQWEVLSLPAIAEAHAKHPRDKRQVGEALWPWLKSAKEILALQEADPREFASLYQQNPTPEGGTEWPESYFGPTIWFDEWPDNYILKVIAVDPSKGKGEGGDYAAIICAMLDRHGKIWVDAALSNMWDANRIAEEVIEQYRSFQPNAIVGEAVLFQHLFLQIFREEGKKSDINNLPMYGLDQVGCPKEVRIRQLGPYLSRGDFRFKRDSRGAKILVNQLKDFPGGINDDGPDALAMAIKMLWYLFEGHGERSSNMGGRIYTA